jgi:DNA-binding MarR family transcriptional regulator
MATTLAALEERALVRRGSDPADRRRAVLTITSAGRKVIHDRRSETIRRLAQVLDTEFTPAEHRRLFDVIPLLERLADRL